MSVLIVMTALAGAGWCVAWLMWRREQIIRATLTATGRTLRVCITAAPEGEEDGT